MVLLLLENISVLHATIIAYRRNHHPAIHCCAANQQKTAKHDWILNWNYIIRHLKKIMINDNINDNMSLVDPVRVLFRGLGSIYLCWIRLSIHSGPAAPVVVSYMAMERAEVMVNARVTSSEKVTDTTPLQCLEFSHKLKWAGKW